MITQYAITGDTWTPITTAGQSGACWLDEQGDGAAGAVDVRLWHGSVPGDAELTESKRVFKPGSNADYCFFGAVDLSDIYYARCANIGDTAILSVDIDGIGVSPAKLSSQASYSKDAVLITEYLPDFIVRDKVYGVGIRATFTAATPVFFTSEIPEVDQPDVNQVILLPITVKPTEGYVTLSIYRDTEWTGGTQVDIGSWNQDLSGDNHKTVVYQSPTTTTGAKGTEIPWLGDTYGVTSTNQSAGGGGGASKNIIPLNKAKRYLYELESSATNLVQMLAEFAEI